MFGKNEIVGKKYFKDAGDRLLVTSVFMTLQGEGPYRGEPAVFVRLAKCNLACSFCDTYFDRGDWFHFEELDTKINQVIEDFFEGNVPYWAQYVEYDEHSRLARRMGLVITGGEPMLQDALGPFLEYMEDEFLWIQIETNGTKYQELPDSVIVVCSPKCSEKNGIAVKYLTPHEKLLERADCLKFVISADTDSPYSSVPDWALDWGHNTKQPVFVSPMNIYNKEPQAAKQLRTNKNDISLDERSTIDEVISFWEEGLLDMAANRKNHEYAAKYAIQNGLTLNLQIHLYASLA